MITLEDFVVSRQLGGACEAFHDLAPWRSWPTFGRALYGLPLDAEGEELFTRCTGRTRYAPPFGGWHEVACVVGRQAGKTRFASALVAFAAAMHPPVRDGQLYALLLAQDARAAQRTALSYIASLLDASPALAGLIVNRTTDTKRTGPARSCADVMAVHLKRPRRAPSEIPYRQRCPARGSRRIV